MRWLPLTLGTALILPHLEGDWRWLALAGFMGLVGLMLRELA